MKRLPALSVLCVLLLAGCGRVVIPPNLAEGPVKHPTTFEHALVARYHAVSESENEDGSISLRPSYGGIVYRPRQSSLAGYEGWDVLDVPRSDSNYFDWLYLTLGRDATLIVLWDDYRGWLGGWAKGPVIDGRQSYRRDFGKGVITLGSPGQNNDAYTVLIAEKGGNPSSEPPLPAGVSENARPQPNQACPSWLHQLYEVTAYNGQPSETWHPQIDPVYWCYFEHEHGADPSLIGYQATFRYVADQNEGFKGYALRDEESGIGWYVNVHSTTSALSRVCAQLHTVVVAAVDLASGELLAELAYKGDFGALRTSERLNGQNVLIQPTFNPSCPDQATIAAQTEAVKLVRVHDQPGLGSSGYEQWMGGLNSNLGMAFRGDTGMKIDIQNPLTACHTLACDYAVATGSNGTRRTIRFSDLTIDHARVAILDGADGNVDGVFYTNPYGTALIFDANDPLAVRQYVKPGLAISLEGGFSTEDAWRGLYSNQAHTTDFELEGSLGATN